ncbi:MAG: serine/threonine protein kinase [Burkholderiales bacterium]|nr:serine/threonine protein kinase [Burkholderiales bacterium]
MTDEISENAAPATAPYADLTPSSVLDALDAVGLRGDGRMLQLNSYENRVFQAFLEDGRVVVAKFYRPERWSDAQILEEHAFAAELAAAEIPVAAPLSFVRDPDSPHTAAVSLVGPTLGVAAIGSHAYRFGACERMAGRAPELDDPEVRRWLGRFIGRMHAVGARARFASRITLDVDSYGVASRDFLLAQGVIPPDCASEWLGLVDSALAACRTAFDAAPLKQLRLHGDCHLGNVLWTERGPHFVDLDDAVNGPAIQDLWMLLSGDRAAMSGQLLDVLEGYESFMDFDWREVRLIEPLRTLRMIHHSAWIARRWEDPAFPIAFPWFAGASYWADQCVRLREQIVAMAEPPIGSPA